MPKITNKVKTCVKQWYPDVKLHRQVCIPLDRCDFLVKKKGNLGNGNGTTSSDMHADILVSSLGGSRMSMSSEIMTPEETGSEKPPKQALDSKPSIEFSDQCDDLKCEKEGLHYETSDVSLSITNIETEKLTEDDLLLNHSTTFMSFGEIMGQPSQTTEKRKNDSKDSENPRKKIKILSEILVHNSGNYSKLLKGRPKVIASYPIDESSVILHQDAEQMLNETSNEQTEREQQVKTLEKMTTELFQNNFGSNCSDDSEDEGSEWDAGSIIESSDYDSDYESCDQKEVDSLKDNGIDNDNLSDIETMRDEISEEISIPLPDISNSFINMASSSELPISLSSNSLIIEESVQLNKNTSSPVPKLDNNFVALGKVKLVIVNKPAEDKSKKKPPPGQRKRKWHMCIFCKTDQSHLKRHMIDKHSDIAEVQTMIQESKNNPASRKPMKKLLNAGDKLLNKAFISGQTNQFKVKDKEVKPIYRIARNPYLKTSVLADYVSCPDCYSSFKGKDFRAHFRRCTKLSAPNLRRTVQLGRRTFYHCHPEASELLRLRILSTMRNDKVVRAIRYDRLIMKFGSDMCMRLRDKKDNKNVKTQLRRLGRLKMLLKVKNLADALHPQRSEEVVTMIEKMASDPENPEVLLHPTVAQNVSGLVKAIAETLKYLCVKDNNKHLKEVAEDFLFNFTRDYYNRLSRHAGSERREHKRNQEKELPSQESIKQLIEFMNKQRRENYEILSKGFDKEAYINLLESTLSSLQVYNRRRPGDVERITLKDYKFLKQINSTTSKAFTSLSPKLQDVAKEYSLLYTQGKLGKDVKLLVSPDIRLCIEMLVFHRNKLDIGKNNIYLFALERTAEQKNEDLLKKLKVDEKRKETMNHPSAYNLLRKFARLCGAERPDLLRCNLLRSQMATECQNLNLDDAGLNHLADFMSHDVRIHKSVYRKDIVEREIPILLNFINTANGIEDDVSHPDEDIDDGQNDQSSTLENTVASEITGLHEETTTLDALGINNSVTTALESSKANGCKISQPVQIAVKKSFKKINKVNTKPGTKKRYSEEEKEVAKEFFADYLEGKTNTVPTASIDALLKNNPDMFVGRNIDSIRTWLHGLKRIGSK